MISKGLLVRLEVQKGKDEEAEAFLKSALPLVEQEPGTLAWFAVKFSGSDYGIFDVFPDDAARDAHLNGPIAKALMGRSNDLFSNIDIDKIEVIADKMPSGAAPKVTKGILLTVAAQVGKGPDMEQFLIQGRSIVVEDEPETIAWFAIQLSDGEYGVFDVFEESGGRTAHLAGQIPRELTKHALTLLGGVPRIKMLDIVESSTQSSEA